MQDSLPAAGPALPGGIGYPQGSCERFHGCNDSPFPSFLARCQFFFQRKTELTPIIRPNYPPIIRDPEWEPYLEARLGWQLAQTLAGRGRIEYLWKVQEGRCVICGQPLRIAEEDCQIHHRIWRTRGGQDTADNMELLHVNCHRQIHVQEKRTKAAAPREGRL